MVQARVLRHVRERSAVPGFGVRASEHDPREAGVDGGARAHRTGLDGDVEGRPVQPPASDGLRRFPDRLDLGMVSRIGERLAPVATPPDHVTAADDDRADRHLALGKGDPGERERFAQESLVVRRKRHRRRVSHGAVLARGGRLELLENRECFR